MRTSSWSGRRAETGLSITVVTRETEAKLAVSGCASLIDFRLRFRPGIRHRRGSSELVWLDLSRRRHTWRHSLSERLEAPGVHHRLDVAAGGVR